MDRHCGGKTLMADQCSHYEALDLSLLDLGEVEREEASLRGYPGDLEQ